VGHKVAERLVVNIVDQHEASDPKSRPRLVHLECHVSGGVQAVVNEQVDLTQLSQELRQPPSAGPPNVRPPIVLASWNGGSNLAVQFRGEGVRKVHAPKAAGAVARQSFEYHL
jgi:hypothetical protein